MRATLRKSSNPTSTRDVEADEVAHPRECAPSTSTTCTWASRVRAPAPVRMSRQPPVPAPPPRHAGLRRRRPQRCLRPARHPARAGRFRGIDRRPLTVPAQRGARCARSTRSSCAATWTSCGGRAATASSPAASATIARWSPRGGCGRTITTTSITTTQSPRPARDQVGCSSCSAMTRAIEPSSFKTSRRTRRSSPRWAIVTRRSGTSWYSAALPGARHSIVYA